MKKPEEKKPGSRKSKTKPNIVHPAIPGAVGSSESPYRDERDTVEESKNIIDDAIERITGKKKQ